MTSNNIYCVYFIHYTGTAQLPPYYIGSTSLDKQLSGYRGSVRSAEYKELWHSEVKNNFDSFTSYVVSIHDTREDAVLAEGELQRFYDAATNPLFVNKRNVNGAFIVTQATAQKVAKIRKENGTYVTGSTKAAATKRMNGSTGKGIPKSEEHANKIANATLGKSKHSWFKKEDDQGNVVEVKGLVSDRNEMINDGWVCFNKDGSVWSPAPLPSHAGHTHSEETKKRLSDISCNVPMVTCPHCNVSIRNKGENFKRHTDVCQRNAEIKRQKELVNKRPKSSCPYCGEIHYNNTMWSHYRKCANYPTN